MKSKIVRVVLNANREDDRRILDYFLYAGKPMSKLFKIAMLQYLDRLDMNGDQEVSLDNIRKVVREETLAGRAWPRLSLLHDRVHTG